MWTSGGHRLPLGPAGEKVDYSMEPKCDSLLREQARHSSPYSQSTLYTYNIIPEIERFTNNNCSGG